MHIADEFNSDNEAVRQFSYFSISNLLQVEPIFLLLIWTKFTRVGPGLLIYFAVSNLFFLLTERTKVDYKAVVDHMNFPATNNFLKLMFCSPDS